MKNKKLAALGMILVSSGSIAFSTVSANDISLADSWVQSRIPINTQGPKAIDWGKDSQAILYNNDHSKIKGIKLSSSVLYRPTATLIINGKDLGSKELDKEADGSYYINILDYQENFAETTDSIKIGIDAANIVFSKETTDIGEIILGETILEGWNGMFYNPPTSSFNINTKEYKINIPSIVTSSGNFTIFYVIKDETTGLVVKYGAAESQDSINVKFSGDGQSTYRITSSYTDHFNGSTVTGDALVHSLKDTQK